MDRVLGRDRRSRLIRSVHEAAPDVVLVLGDPELEPGLFEEARTARSARWINWFPDDARSARAAAAHSGLYDAVCAVGTDVAREIGELTGRPVEVLPFGADPSVYRPQRGQGWYRANVVFAGTATPRRETLLAGLVEFGIALWGPGWRATALKDYCRGELLRTDEYVKAYNGASVAVNIHHRAADDGEEASCNQRLFELAAMGAAQVVDHRLDLPDQFQPGREVLTYKTAEELRALVRELLADPAMGETLGANARRAALSRHTYMHRGLRLLELVGAPA